MASAAGVRPDVIAREFAGERAAIAIVRAVSRRREEVAGFGFRPGEEGAKETQSIVYIIYLIGRSVWRNLQLVSSSSYDSFLSPGWCELFSRAVGAITCINPREIPRAYRIAHRFPHHRAHQRRVQSLRLRRPQRQQQKLPITRGISSSSVRSA
jgi:hypothetical protein